MVRASYWYIVFVIGGKEDVICRFMNKESDDWHAFVPKIEMLHTKKGELYIAEKVMFPNYIFVESDITSSEFQRKLKMIREKKSGIIKELWFDEETPALRYEERAYLEGLLNCEYKLTKSIGYMKQDQVLITEGALMGYEANIVRIDRHKKKATLHIDLLNKETKITVSLEIIKKDIN